MLFNLLNKINHVIIHNQKQGEIYMEYKLIEYLNLNQLKDLRKELENNSDFDKELLEEINKRIDKKERNNINVNAFSSSRMPYYTEENEKSCNNIMEQITIDELAFFTQTFHTSGNRNGKINYSRASAYLAKIYNTSVDEIEKLSFAPNCSPCFKKLPFIKMEKFFEEEYFVTGYENIYNTYNYIKNYIYQCLLTNPDATKKEIFKDYELKQILVIKNLREIAKYLYDDIVEIEGLRMSVPGHSGLKRTSIKTSSGISFNQERMVEAVAFGTTLDKLKDANYEDSKRLLYLPRSKQ